MRLRAPPDAAATTAAGAVSPVTTRGEIEAIWSAEGQVAALAASVVALADAMGLEAASTLDERLSAPDFDFSTVLSAHTDTGSVLPALLRGVGLDAAEGLNDPSLDDTALMIVCQDSLSLMSALIGESVDALLTLTEVHQLDAEGLRLAQYLSSALQGQMMMLATRDALPAQLPMTAKATAALANALALAVPDLPWTADRWPLADQVSTLQSLCGLMQGFDVETGGILNAATACAAGGFGASQIKVLHLETAAGLEHLNHALDQWSPASEPQPASTSEVVLIQGALARAREVLEHATGQPE